MSFFNVIRSPFADIKQNKRSSASRISEDLCFKIPYVIQLPIAVIYYGPRFSLVNLGAPKPGMLNSNTEFCKNSLMKER